MAITGSGIRAATLEVHVTADTDNVEKGLDRSDSKLRSFAAGAAKVGLVAAAAGGAAGIAFGVKAVQGASDLAEQVSKTNVVFGDSSKIVHDFTAGMARDFGIPKTQILDAASSIGLIGKASGLSQGEAAKMSTQLAQMATDASSFYNVPLEEALGAIRSGLVGEAEPMRRFGVLMNAAAVEAEALRLGLVKQGEELTEGVKSQARASLIMRGMSDASGDLARTQDGLANRLREVRGRATNFAADIGTKLLPMVLAVFDAGEKWGASLSKVLLPIFTEIGGGIRAMVLSFKDWENGTTSSGVAGVFENIGISARRVFEFLRVNVPPVVDHIRTFARAVLPALARGFGAVVVGAAAFLANVGPPLVAALGPVLRIISAIVTALMPGMGTAMGTVLGVAGEVVGFLLGALEPALLVIEGAVNLLATAFANPAFPEVAAFIGTVLSPVIVGLGIHATATAAKVVAGWVSSAAASVTSTAAQAANFVKIGIGWSVIAAQAIASAASVVWGWVTMAASAIASAAPIAAAWIIAFGPIALVVAAVIGLAVVIVKNWDTIKDATAAAARWVGDKIGDIWNFFKELPGKILRAYDKAGDLLLGTGKDIVRGLWNGIWSMKDWIIGKLTGFVSNVIPGPIKKVLGIFSPSRVTMGLGKEVAAGLAMGILAGAPAVDDAARSMLTPVRNAQAGDWGVSGATMRPGDVAGRTNAPGGSGDTYVDIRVAGNVITERELMEAVREYLIRTGRANTSAMGGLA